MDIVERLREGNLVIDYKTAQAAADEIERLRETAKDRPKDRPKDAADEIERLREALKDLLQCPAIADGSHNEPAWYDSETAVAEKNARAALKGDE